MKKALSLILALVMILFAFAAAGCSDKKDSDGEDKTSERSGSETPKSDGTEGADAGDATSGTDLPDTEPEGSEADIAAKRAEIEALKAQYPDVYGWITVPDTHIDHPIMQTTDNEWYLNHSFNGTFLVTGSIFADYTCSRSILDNYNTVLYGHNVTTGEMFHDVTKFLDEDFVKTKKIYVCTPDGTFVFEPFAVFETSADSGCFCTEFENGDDFIAFAREMRDNSKFVRDVDFSADDRLLTLSATDGENTQCLCLAARLVESDK